MNTTTTAAPAVKCDGCGAECDGKHGACIGGGGVLPLCDDCRARLCACGGFMIPKGAVQWIECTERHRHHRCEDHNAPADPERLTWYCDRPAGCACDLCRIQ